MNAHVNGRLILLRRCCNTNAHSKHTRLSLRVKHIASIACSLRRSACHPHELCGSWAREGVAAAQQHHRGASHDPDETRRGHRYASYFVQ